MIISPTGNKKKIKKEEGINTTIASNNAYCATSFKIFK
jgi:hypothetical protein